MANAMRRPDLYNGAAVPRGGVLLTGPSGTGKTLAAMAFANEAGCTFFEVKLDFLISGKDIDLTLT